MKHPVQKFLRNNSSPNTRSKGAKSSIHSPGGQSLDTEPLISMDRNKNAQSRRELNNESELMMYNYQQQDYAYVMMVEEKGSMFDTLDGGCKYNGAMTGKKQTDPLLEMCSQELRDEQLI